ncbi:MAG: transglutaminase family protein [Nitrospinota bacterium]
MKGIKLYFIICCLCVVFFGAIIKHGDARIGLTESNYSIHRQIQYSFTLQNRTNRLLKKAEFWTYAPLKQTSTQRCVNLEISHPYQLILDDLGNQILYFKFHNLSPYTTKIITIKADLTLSDTPNPIPVTDINAFLRAEKYIESDDPGLSRFAKKFKAPKPVETVEGIFRWVAENVQYAGYLRNDRGALYALRNKQGDCTEFTSLFVALCRANNIPARGIGGYVCSENNILKPNDYHNWAEFYDDDVWRIADPQKKVFMQDQSNYIAMKVIGESPKNPMRKFHWFRFAGDGLKVKMNQ